MVLQTVFSFPFWEDLGGDTPVSKVKLDMEAEASGENPFRNGAAFSTTRHSWGLSLYSQYNHLTSHNFHLHLQLHSLVFHSLSLLELHILLFICAFRLQIQLVQHCTHLLSSPSPRLFLLLNPPPGLLLRPVESSSPSYPGPSSHSLHLILNICLWQWFATLGAKQNHLERF